MTKISTLIALFVCMFAMISEVGALRRCPAKNTCTLIINGETTTLTPENPSIQTDPFEQQEVTYSGSCSSCSLCGSNDVCDPMPNSGSYVSSDSFRVECSF